MRESEIQRATHNRRILFVQYTNPAAYPPLVHISRILLDRQWELAFFGAHPGGSGELRFPPHPRMAVRMMGQASPGWRQKLHYCAYLVRAVAFGAPWRPAWIYASDPLACIPALVLSRILGSRVAYHEHDSPSGGAPSAFWRLVLRARNALARRASACVLPNAGRLKEFVDETGASRETSFCVWNCPSKSESESHSERPDRNQFWLHYHGNINRECLPPELIDSLALLPDQVCLRVVGYETLGSRGYLADLLLRADARGVAPRRLVPCGLLQRSEMLALAREGHLGLALMPKISSNRNMRQMVGASNKAFEYLACGLPVLVSALEDWEAMFVRPGYGLACDPARAEDIARAVRWLLDHPAERSAMASAGRARVRDDWNYESQFAPVLAVLERGRGALSGPQRDDQSLGPLDFDAGPASATSAPPMFSICVPHYNRTPHLLVALKALAAQTDRDVELCLSDDRSTDGEGERLRSALRASGFAVRYRLQPSNLRYDGNLRSAIGLSRGRFCLLMGNDDCLSGPQTLATLRRAIETYRDPSAVITDFADWRSGIRSRRILETRLLPGGPAAALAGFRNASFVSGVLLAGDPARALATERWDGSEMYQVYLLCRIVAAGGALLQIAEPLVLKDIIVEGEHVDSYADEPRLDPCPIVPRDKPLARLPALAATAIAEGAGLRGRPLRRCHFAVARQLYAFTFAYWLMEYRRIQSRAYALGVALALAPSRACRDLELGAMGRAAIWSLYVGVVAAAMVMPLSFFSGLRAALYRLAKLDRGAGS